MLREGQNDPGRRQVGANGESVRTVTEYNVAPVEDSDFTGDGNYFYRPGVSGAGQVLDPHFRISQSGAGCPKVILV